MTDKEASRKRKHPAATEADPVIPDKLYFRIGEVARLLAVEPHVLRFWENEFPQLKPGKGGTGQRLYRKRDVEMALRVKRLLYREGYTIPGARQLLKLESREKQVTERTPEDAPPAGLQPAGLQKMRAQLREISSILARPMTTPFPPPLSAKGKSTRGLHLAARKPRSARGANVLLFPEDQADGQGN